MSEIKISDLSVGDWVRMGGKNFQIYHLTLAGDVYGYRRTNNSFTGEEYYDGEIGDVQPIPLTPEILKKNGWVQRDQWNWRNPHIKCSCCRYGRKYWDIHIYGKGRKYRPTRITIENILHTHQLQHALRLACVGKEIEL